MFNAWAETCSKYLDANVLSHVFRFSVGKLPGWAKTKIIASSSPPAAPSPAAAAPAKSRWADRAGGGGPPTAVPLRPYDNIIVEDDSSPKEGSSLEWSATPRTPSSMSEMGSMSPHPAAQIRHVGQKRIE